MSIPKQLADVSAVSDHVAVRLPWQNILTYPFYSCNRPSCGVHCCVGLSANDVLAGMLAGQEGGSGLLRKFRRVVLF